MKAISCYSVEVPQLNHQEFTEKNGIDVEGLLPYTKTGVVIRSCTRRDVIFCGSPAYLQATTAVDGECPDIDCLDLLKGSDVLLPCRPFFQAPSEPTGVNATDMTEGSVLVTWIKPATPNGPIDGYEISATEFGNDDSNWTDIQGSEPSFQLCGLVLSTNYTLHLVAYNLAANRTRLKSANAELVFSTREYSKPDTYPLVEEFRWESIWDPE